MENQRSASGSPDSAAAGDKDSKKKDANRACDFCHRMKMKCIGKENPPCNRCRSSGHECTFDGPRKTKSSKVDERLRQVESQMTTMSSALEELLKMQKAALSNNNMPPPPTRSSTGDSGSQHMYSQPPNPFDNMDPMQNAFNAGYGPRHSFSGPFSTPQSQLDMGNNMMGLPQYQTQTLPVPPLTSHSVVTPAGQGTPLTGQRTTPVGAGGAEGALQEGDDDPLNHASLNPWASMCSLAEAARLKNTSIFVPDDNDPSRGPSKSQSPKSAAKKRKRGPERSSGLKPDYDTENPHYPQQYPFLPHFLPKQDFVQQPPDPIDLGFCDEKTAKEMYDLFIENSLVYMPCFDPAFDTFESLRRRSTMCITTIIMIGAKVRDTGSKVSSLQRKCREYAETIAMATLFTPVTCLEGVQAMIILASWGDTSWRPGGHATRMAMDLGLYRCLPLLARSGMGKGKTAKEARGDWSLVEGARTWLTLYKMESEMAYNLGRPPMIGGVENIRYSRDLLTHPLSVQYDARLVAACELLSLRIPLHNPLALTAAEAAVIPDLDAKLEQHHTAGLEWFEYWDKYYEDRGVPKDNFLRETLITHKAGADLNINTRLLHDLRNRADVAALPPHRVTWIRRAVTAASQIVGKLLKGGGYREKFRSANIYTHYNVAFAARCLIRLASLAPDIVNVEAIGKDVEEVTAVLNEVPGFQFGELLRGVVDQARRKHFLPPAGAANHKTATSQPPFGNQDMPSQPYGVNLNVNGIPGTQQQQAHDGSMFGLGNVGDMQAFNGLGGDTQGSPFDFTYADHLFSNSLPASKPAEAFGFRDLVHLENAMPLDPAFNPEAWFPFPALEFDNEGNMLGAAPSDPSNLTPSSHSNPPHSGSGGINNTPDGGLPASLSRQANTNTTANGMTEDRNQPMGTGMSLGQYMNSGPHGTGWWQG